MVYFIKTKKLTTSKIITTQTMGLTRSHIKIDRKSMTRSKIRIPANITIKTTIMVIRKIPTALPIISAMA
ncbi:hypothetical protein [Methanobacterium subterraneum]|uniref:hypothetical protein n=1 Tax=Methanobacterium subterraneum TaxID=59277 RepID=UPI00194DB7A2|nr:hypothetical protein [Methanobacterium subterraneum]